MSEAMEFFPNYNNNGNGNGFSSKVDHYQSNHLMLKKEEEEEDSWFEEVIDDDLKWSFALNRYL